MNINPTQQTYDCIAIGIGPFNSFGLSTSRSKR